MFDEGTIEVVPMITLMALAVAPRTPVKCNSSTVGTGDPLAFGEVTLNGSVWHPDTVGFVTLQITALPFGPFVVVTISGCAATIAMWPRITVPLLLMTIG